MEAKQAAEWMLRFIEEFTAQYPGDSGYLLLNPDNILVAHNKISLRQKDPASAYARYYAGFSAPEAPDGHMDAFGAVYFCGAVLYTLLIGAPPPDARDRLTNNLLVFAGPSPLMPVVNRAMALRSGERYTSLSALAGGLWRFLQENGITPPSRPTPAAPPRAAAPNPRPPEEKMRVVELSRETPAPVPPQEEVPPTPPTDPEAPFEAPQNTGEKPQQKSSDNGQENATENTSKIEAKPKSVSEKQPQNPVYSAPKHRRRKKSWVRPFVVVLVILLLAGGFAGYSLVQRGRADTAFAGGNYAGVVQALDAAPWMKASREAPYQYANAGLLLAEGKLDEAIVLLEPLGDFEDSQDLVLAAKYDKATLQMNSGQLRESLEAFTALGGYQDSADISAKLTAYLEAYQASDAVSQYCAFNDLGTFLDSAEKADLAAKVVYDYARELLTAEQIDLAYETFYLMQGYQDAALYAEACNLWRNASDVYTGNDEAMPRLIELAAQVEIAPILMSDRFFGLFVEGDWTAEDDETMAITANNFSFSAYRSQGKDWAFGQRSIYNDSGTLATFAYRSYDEVEVTMTEDGTVRVYKRDAE